MSAWRSMQDVLLIARFELLRALRTRRALAMVLTWLVVCVGGAVLFVQGLAEAEEAVAATLGVPPARWPGTLTEQLRESDGVRRVLRAVTGDAAAVDDVARWPFLAIFNLWLGLLLVPFLAALQASEAVAPDVASRAIRYELLRTGRGEIVAGRLLGQLGLMAVAVAVSLAGVWTVGMTMMARQSPFELAYGLVALGGRSVVFALPYVGVGMAASMVTASPGWARVLALTATASTWGLYGLAMAAEEAPWTWLADAVLPLLPPSWMLSFWRLDTSLLEPVVVCVALGAAWTAVGAMVLARRDL